MYVTVGGSANVTGFLWANLLVVVVILVVAVLSFVVPGIGAS